MPRLRKQKKMNRKDCSEKPKKNKQTNKLTIIMKRTRSSFASEINYNLFPSAEKVDFNLKYQFNEKSNIILLK